jgi:DNA-binding FadR family transcriptional regulator
VILSGDAAPGMTIPLGEVAALFGVSPIPVRESLKSSTGRAGVLDEARDADTLLRTAAEHHDELCRAVASLPPDP